VSRRLALWLLPLALAGCARSREVVVPPTDERPANNWHRLATRDDRDRLRNWRDSWTTALDQARPAAAAAIAREGALLDPDAGAGGAPPPPGDYVCRWLKLGALRTGGIPFSAGAPQRCRLRAEGSRLQFFTVDGPQRPIGILFPDPVRHRLVFLGTLQLGDEALTLRYGYDQERDMAGFVQSMGEGRWRLVLPAPHFESLLDVIELTPAR
jgi:hypothetical protein